MERTTIFTLPVYALSRKALDGKVEKKIDRIRKSMCEGCDEDITRMVIEREVFPYKCWKYNHIVGYIEVSAGLNDVYFNLYLPYKKKRYTWDSGQKWLLTNEGHDYAHFRVYDDDSTEAIFDKIRDYLAEAIKMFPQRCYVDLESFHVGEKYLDIKRLLHDVRERYSQE